MSGTFPGRNPQHPVERAHARISDKAGWLEMKTMIGWSPRWCELKGRTGQFIRAHEKGDRTTRKLSDLRKAAVQLEKGHTSERYIEVAYAISPVIGVHTLRLRAASAAEAEEWMAAIFSAQLHHTQSQPGGTRVFTVRKAGGRSGRVGLHLKRASIDRVEEGGPAEAAGLRPGMRIVRVCDTLIKLNDEKETSRSIAAAPEEFEIEVRLPQTDYNTVSKQPPNAAKILGLAGQRDPKYHLPSAVLKEIKEWTQASLKIMVVLWGWGNSVECRHMLVSGANITACDVHRQLSSDHSWLSARDIESSKAIDSKAVYFAGPSAGPSKGRQQRILPSQSLASVGLTSGNALHVVSPVSRAHLEAFIASAEEPVSPPRRPSSGFVTVEEHEAALLRKDLEIRLLKSRIAELTDALELAGAEVQTVVPWDEEEPSVVASLRDRVDAATTLDELESLSVQEEDAKFFTPVATPTNTDWRGVDEVVFQSLSLEPAAAAEALERKWTGPADGLRVGEVLAVKPRGSIDDLGPNEASEGFAEGWNLRNVGYKKTGEKVPSLDSMYSFVGVDVYKSSEPLVNVASKMQVPTIDFDARGLPPVIVFNLMIPFCEAPSLWGQETGGPTANVIVTFVLKEYAADAFDDIPAAALTKKFYDAVSENGSAGTEAPFLGSFKFLVRAEKGVPKAFSRYNGKPVLVTKSGKFFKSDKYLQVDCNLRCWAYAARAALYSMWGAIPQYKLHVGCCVEAREDATCPERILGCAQISHLDLEGARPWPGDAAGSPEAVAS